MKKVPSVSAIISVFIVTGVLSAPAVFADMNQRGEIMDKDSGSKEGRMNKEGMKGKDASMMKQKEMDKKEMMEKEKQMNKDQMMDKKKDK